MFVMSICISFKGSGAQGFNPKYAADIFVTVPNVHINSYEAVELGGEMPSYSRNESSFENAYHGYSTRKIVMEERNVYCGAYNVLVLSEKYVLHFQKVVP